MLWRQVVSSTGYFVKYHFINPAVLLIRKIYIEQMKIKFVLFSSRHLRSIYTAVLALQSFIAFYSH
jgi:hypothetical protein